LKEQEKILQRLQNDPAYVEKIIRQRLHYAKPDEFIFNFRE
jgi:cell division protein DivIC